MVCCGKCFLQGILREHDTAVMIASNWSRYPSVEANFHLRGGRGSCREEILFLQETFQEK